MEMIIFNRNMSQEEERHASSAWLSSLNLGLGMCAEHGAFIAPYFVFLLVSEKHLLGTCVFLTPKESIYNAGWPLSLHVPKLSFRL